MYKYSQDNAATYSTLEIKGTTYELGFSETEKILGDLTGQDGLMKGKLLLT